MRGSRCKALRREFRQQHGQAPGESINRGKLFLKGIWYQVTEVSQWRRVKKAYKEGRRRGRR